MGKPFGIKFLGKRDNNLLSKIGLTFFVAAVNSALLNKTALKNTLMSTYKTTFKHKASMIKSIRENHVIIILKYAVGYTNAQRLKNKLGLNLYEIHDLAKDNLNNFKYLLIKGNL